MDEDKKKQIPFRYNESLEKDFEEVFKLQNGYSKKKNLAIKHAIIITAALIRKKSNLKKFKDSHSYDICMAITDDLKIDRLPWQ